jgi:hypothetical protein
MQKRRPARAYALAMTTALGVVLLMSTGSSSLAGEEAPDSQEAASSTEAGGRTTLDRFERCEQPGTDERPPVNVEILLHADAPTATDASDLESQSARATRARLASAIDADAGKLRCVELEAPSGDVDYEVTVTFAGVDARPKVELVDVLERNLLAPVAYSSGTDRCMADVMGKTSCAAAANGVAVQSTLGRIVCARGQCSQERGGRWRCSRAAGGWAELAHDGVRCQQGCYSPTSGQCHRL